MKKRKRSKNKDRNIIIVCLIVFMLCIAGIIYYYYYNDNELEKSPKESRKLNIVDLDSNERPIAIMIDNNIGYNNQIGLQDSYLNYEIIVEGGLTRIMAIYKDKVIDKIGPIRSSRHYFLDYASESDAIYSHYGWSTYAENDIKALGIDNINGLTDSAYYRDKNIKAPHNVFSSTGTLYKYAKSKNYSVTSNDWQLLDYSFDEIEFKTEDNETDNRLVANSLVLKYSNYQTTSYTYDADNRYYLRYMDGKEHIDKETGRQLHYKNIIIEFVENRDLDSEGRQDLDTTGTGNGYYVTNGFALPITWSKSQRTSKTKYKYMNGSSVKVNDGNTFIQIIPKTTRPEFN